MIRIAVLMGGISTEHEISLQTGSTVIKNLNQSKYHIYPVVISKDGLWHVSQNPLESGSDPISHCSAQQIQNAEDGISQLRNENIDIVYIALHGPFGEDGVIQGLLQAVGLAYTGSGVMSSAVSMDKGKSNEIYSYHGLDVAPFETLKQSNYKSKIIELMGSSAWIPCVIKPIAGGSSKFTHLVDNIEQALDALNEAFKFEEIMMIQKYTKGIEVTCAVLDTDNEAIALPPTEIVPKNSSFFDFESKYDGDAVDEITPPRLPQESISRIQEIALQAHQMLGCSGLSRTDIIIQEEHFWILETNTIPGMTETSLYPQAAAMIGLDFPSLLDKIIEHGLRVKR